MASKLHDHPNTNENVTDNCANLIKQPLEENKESRINSSSKKKLHNEKKKNHFNHHRRKPSKKKRKWKPYSKMTWEEKKAVEEKEKARADRIRGEMLNRGRPVAPYNTTQFIMAEHDPYEEEPIYDSEKNNKSLKDENASIDNIDDNIEAEYTDSPHMAPEFISQDFSEAYERVQEESLSTMTRDDLVKEHLSLERTLSYLQEKLAQEKNINNSYSVKVQNIEEELDKLRNDNARLVKENVRLRFGEEAVSNLVDSIYQTSDYEYEPPTSDNEASKYPQGYDCDYEETRADMDCVEEICPQVGDIRRSNSVSPSREDEVSYEPDDSRCDDSDEKHQKPKKRHRYSKEKTISNKRNELSCSDCSSDGEDAVVVLRRNSISHLDGDERKNNFATNNNDTEGSTIFEKEPDSGNEPVARSPNFKHNSQNTIEMSSLDNWDRANIISSENDTLQVDDSMSSLPAAYESVNATSDNLEHLDSCVSMQSLPSEG